LIIRRGHEFLSAPLLGSWEQTEVLRQFHRIRRIEITGDKVTMLPIQVLIEDLRVYLLKMINGIGNRNNISQFPLGVAGHVRRQGRPVVREVGLMQDAFLFGEVVILPVSVGVKETDVMMEKSDDFVTIIKICPIYQYSCCV
jgi:hypothetical protein